MCRKKARTLVAVNEGMVVDDTGAIGGRQIKNRWITAIGMEVARLIDGAFEKTRISDLRGASKAGDRSNVDYPDD